MQKAHSRINWENEPSLNTPLGANNLNKMDKAIDVIDDRVLSLYGYEGRVATSEKNAKASEVNAKTSENNAKESEELAKQYAENAFNGTPEGYEKLVEDVRLMDIKQTTDTTLANSKAGGYKLLSMSGNSVQKTYTGKNLLQNTATTTTANGVTFTVNADGSVTANGTATANTSFVIGIFNALSGIAYTLNGCPSGGSGSTYAIMDGTPTISDLGNGATKTYSEDTTLQIRIRIGSGTTVSNLKFYPMIRLASITDATYEPYVGGIPSPNPEYPQSIHNVGDCVEMIQGGWQVSNGTYFADNARICTKNQVPCTSGDVIKIATEKTPVANGYQIVFYANGTYLTSSYGSGTSNEYSATVPSGATSFVVTLVFDENTTPSTVGKISLTINGKYVVQIPINGTQLFNKSNTRNGYYDASGNLTDVSNDFWQNQLRPLKAGKYTISGIASANSGCRMCAFDSNGKFISVVTVYQNGTFTVPEGTKDVGIVCKKADLDTFMLNEGEVALPYEEYKETVATVLLEAPLHETDVMGNKEVVRKRASVVFDGSNDEGWYASSTATSGLYRLIAPLPNLKSSGDYVKPNIISSQYQTLTPAELWTPKKGISVGASTSVILVYDENFNTSDASLWKAHLQSNPITVEYELATPTSETLDADSQIALNSLETFDGVTYINVDSRTLPSEIKGEYGTSKVGARTIKNELKNDTLEIKYNQLVSSMLAVAESEE